MSADPAFHSGQFGKISVGATPVDLPVAKWGMTEKGNNRDVSNARDKRKRIPGLPDADGEFMCPYDTANDPTVTANGGIRKSAILNAKFYVDATHYWSGSIIVDECGVGMEIEGEIQFPVKWSLESGEMTPPDYGS